MSAYAMFSHSTLPRISPINGCGRNENDNMKINGQNTTSLFPKTSSPRISSSSIKFVSKTPANQKSYTASIGNNSTTGKNHVITTPTMHNELQIAVKSAVVDPLMLVRSSSRGKEGIATNSSSYSRANSSTELAIRFELSITLNGRKYTATRTLPNFVQLRDDLTNELCTNRYKLRGRGGRGHKLERRGSKDEEEWDTELEQCSLVPELPPCFGASDSSSSFSAMSSLPMGKAGRGFAMVQAMIRSYYCPAMERWIQSVADVIHPDDSPCFTRFLWEPLQNGVDGSRGKDWGKTRPCLWRKRSSGNFSMKSIGEDEESIEDSDED